MLFLHYIYNNSASYRLDTHGVNEFMYPKLHRNTNDSHH